MKLENFIKDLIKQKKFNRKSLLILLFAILTIILILIIIPDPDKILYKRFGLIITDENGVVLRSYLNKEDSWCLVDFGEIPDNIAKSVIFSEDRWFYYHFGINPVALIRALLLNIKYKRVVSGGSTITMQVARIAGRNKRNVFYKFYEILQAIKLEILYSKNYILKLYLNYAPYGGNIYGYKSAALRYFGKNPENLSWAEAATLAVLPNAPGLVSPTKSNNILKAKRDALLHKLFSKKIIDSITLEMSLNEEIANLNIPFEIIAPQFCDYVKKRYTEKSNKDYGIVNTTLNAGIQKLVEDIVKANAKKNSLIGINNACAIVIDGQTTEVKAWVASQDFYDEENKGQVNGVIAPRSTGSVLKPFLYAMAIDRGILIPQTLISDIPSNFGSYSPSNSDGKFNGLVTAKEALTRSLNVPAVKILSKIGVDNFYRFLKRAGLKNLFRNSEEYGLPLILGGAEASLYEISGLYLGLARYGVFVEPKIIKEKNSNFKKNLSEKSARLISEGASYLILDVLKEVRRPNSEQLWEYFSSLNPIAWKTGTSYGYKDAWAIGVTPSYIVGVWCGNFDGTPNVLLSGSKVAGNLMLEIFRALESEGKNKAKNIWFSPPKNKLINIEICSKTGYSAGPFCMDKILAEFPISAVPLTVCPYHTVIYTTIDGRYEVCSSCWEPGKYEKKYILNWPAEIMQFLRDRRLLSEARPPHNPACPGIKKSDNVSIIYPLNGITIVIPKDFDGKYQKIAFSAASRKKEISIFWYLNGLYLGKTIGINNFEYLPEPGENILTIVDGESGDSVSVKFNVIYASN